MKLVDIIIKGEKLLLNADKITTLRILEHKDKFYVGISWLPKNSAILTINNKTGHDTLVEAEQSLNDFIATIPIVIVPDEPTGDIDAGEFGGIFDSELDAGEFGEAFTGELDAGEFV